MRNWQSISGKRTRHLSPTWLALNRFVSPENLGVISQELLPFVQSLAHRNCYHDAETETICNRSNLCRWSCILRDSSHTPSERRCVCPRERPVDAILALCLRIDAAWRAHHGSNYLSQSFRGFESA